MILPALDEARDALRAICDALSIDAIKFSTHDHSHKLDIIERNVRTSIVLTISESQLLRGRDTLGDALHFEVRANELIYFALAATPEDDWTGLPTRLTGLEHCEVRLRVDKRELVRRWYASSADQIRVYFSRASLENDLRDCLLNPADLSQHLWRDFGASRVGLAADDIDRRSVVIVAASDLLIEGPLLTVVGNDRDQPLPSLEMPSGDYAPDSLGKVWSAAEKELRWDDISAAVGLTPAHLQIDRLSGTPGEAASLLLVHWSYLCVMWLADRVTRERNGNGQVTRLVAQINGDRATARIILTRLQPRTDGVCHHHVQALSLLTFSAFKSSFPADRLKLARIAVARALQFEPPDKAAERLLDRATTIWSDHDWQWTQFSGGKIDSYLKDERELEDRVTKTVEAFDSRTSDMIKAVSDSALASIAALVGSMVASLFGGKFNETVFKVGLYAYAGYVVLFPCIFGLTHLVLRYRISRRGYDAEQARIVDLIGRDRVEKVVDQRITRTSNRFWWCFTISIIAYFLICALSIVASIYVPSTMAPTPTPHTSAATQQDLDQPPRSSPH